MYSQKIHEKNSLVDSFKHNKRNLTGLTAWWTQGGEEKSKGRNQDTRQCNLNNEGWEWKIFENKPSSKILPIV